MVKDWDVKTEDLIDFYNQAMDALFGADMFDGCPRAGGKGADYFNKFISKLEALDKIRVANN